MISHGPSGPEKCIFVFRAFCTASCARACIDTIASFSYFDYERLYDFCGVGEGEWTSHRCVCVRV